MEINVNEGVREEETSTRVSQDPQEDVSFDDRIAEKPRCRFIKLKEK